MSFPSPASFSSVGALFAQIAAANADKAAYKTPRRDYRYGEIDDAVRRVAEGLRSLGLQPGDRVAALTRHVTECTVLVLAAARIGAVCCPVNWRLSGPEAQQVIHHSEARFLMLDADFLPLVDSLALPRIRERVLTLAEPGATLPALLDWAAGFAPSGAEHPAQVSDTALQLYSSGTTGLPKGVELTHRNLLRMCETVPQELGFEPGRTVILNALPVFHIAGMGMSLAALAVGGTTVASSEFSPPKVIAGFAEHGITHTFMVPSMIQVLLQTPGVEEADYRTLKLIGYGASPITEKVLVDALRVFQCQLTQTYGLTETTGAIVALRPHDHAPSGDRAHLLRAAGQPLVGVGLRIVDAATLQDLPDGEVGEVWIHSDLNMKQYWRNPEATREAYPEGQVDHVGWFRSGDAGYLQDGYLFIRDRIKDMIISGGENIYPIEVENALVKHPAVADCAVIAVPDEKWGETVKACVVLKPGSSTTEDELIRFCKDRIAHYKSPRSVSFMDTLPRNPSGKLLKKLLREQYRSA